MSAQLPEFTVRLLSNAWQHVIVVSGELDLQTSSRLRAQVESVVTYTENDLVIDLSRVGYVDSTGLSVLLAAQEHLAAINRRLILRNPSTAVLLLLRVCDVADRFSIELDDPVTGAIAETVPE